MTDLLERAATWLDGQRSRHLSRQVTYVRGEDYVELAATMGSTEVEVMDDAGATVVTKAADFIVTASDLVLAAERVEPRVGDRIRVAAGDQVLVYEVLELAGAGHFRPADPFGVALRIHAKLVDAEEAA